MIHPDSTIYLNHEVLAIGGVDFTFHGKEAHAS